MKARSSLTGLFFGIALPLLVACTDSGKKSAALAATNAVTLAKLVEKDVSEIHRGLPAGAKKGSTLFLTGKHELDREPASVRRSLMKVQREVPDLLVAKSTFFALADDKGFGVRNNLEVDAMAGQNLFGLFPELEKARSSDLTQTVGTFGAPQGDTAPDKTWVAASPIKDAENKVIAFFVTGWAYRAFAFHLQEALKMEMKSELVKEGTTGKMPILYVAVIDSSGVYSAPQTPPICDKAFRDQNIVEKTTTGPASGSLELEGRTYGWAGARVPTMAKDTAVAILRSEI